MNYFAVVQLLSPQFVQALNFISSQKKTFINVSEQISFWQLNNFNFFSFSYLIHVYLEKKTSVDCDIDL